MFSTSLWSWYDANNSTKEMCEGHSGQKNSVHISLKLEFLSRQSAHSCNTYLCMLVHSLHKQTATCIVDMTQGQRCLKMFEDVTSGEPKMEEES